MMFVDMLSSGRCSIHWRCCRDGSTYVGRWNNTASCCSTDGH